MCREGWGDESGRPKRAASVRVEARLHTPERILDRRKVSDPFLALAHAAVAPDQEGLELAARKFFLAVGFVGLEDAEKQLSQLAVGQRHAALPDTVHAFMTGLWRIQVEHIGQHVEEVAVWRIDQPTNIVQSPTVVSTIVEPLQEFCAVVGIGPLGAKLVLVGDYVLQIAEQTLQELGGRDRLAVRAPVGRGGNVANGPCFAVRKLDLYRFRRVVSKCPRGGAFVR